MFSLFASPEKKMRQHAANWLEVAAKVWNFRRDRLSHAEAAELTGRADELRQQLKDRAEPAKLKLSIEALESVLRKTGGTIYPQSTLGEYVEFFLVAAIVILGFRTFFIQPFKIPTNSMWPTYYGMTAENIPPAEAAPGAIERAFRLVAFGAQRKEVVAPADGDVTAVFTSSGSMAYTVQKDRTWLIFPTQVREYTFGVGGKNVTVRVPLDFHRDFDRVLRETLFGGDANFERHFLRYIEFQREAARAKGSVIPEGSAYKMAIKTGVKKGDVILRFDLLTGDQLFVDRMSYHFMRPKVGQGFVFRTDNIPGIGQAQYYIKRLVGTPGDVLEQRAPMLYRNGRPIEGSKAFLWNNGKTTPYRGYGFGLYDPRDPNGPKFLLSGSKLTIPAKSYFAMGDNSYESSDSRFWGFVPEADVIGRPLFIYYPFTKRWGFAR